MSVEPGRARRGRHRLRRQDRDDRPALLGAGAIATVVAIAAITVAFVHGRVELVPLLAGMVGTVVAALLAGRAGQGDPRVTLGAYVAQALAWTAAVIVPPSWAPHVATLLLGGGSGILVALLATGLLLRTSPVTRVVRAGVAATAAAAGAMVVAAFVPATTWLPPVAGAAVAFIACAIACAGALRGLIVRIPVPAPVARHAQKVLAVLEGDTALPSQRRRVLAALGLALGLAALEMSFGAIEGSHSLLADAFHVLDDTALLAGVFVGVIMQMRRGSAGQWDVRGAQLGGALLVSLGIWTAYDTVTEWGAGPAPGGLALVLVSLAAMAVNGITLPLLNHVKLASGEAAKADTKADLIGSSFGLLAGVVTLYSERPEWDALAALAMCALMIRAGASILWAQRPKRRWSEEEGKLPVHQPRTMLRLLWLAVALGIVLGLAMSALVLATDLGVHTGLGSAGVIGAATVGLGLLWVPYVLTAALRWFALTSIAVVGAAMIGLALTPGQPLLGAILIGVAGMFAVTPYLAFERVPDAVPSHFGGRAATSLFTLVLWVCVYLTETVAVELNELVGIGPALITLSLLALAAALHATHAHLPRVAAATHRSPRNELRSIGHALGARRLWPVIAMAALGGVVLGSFVPQLARVVELAIGTGYETEQWLALLGLGFPLGALLASGALLVWTRWDHRLAVAALMGLAACGLGVVFGGTGDVALALLPFLLVGRVFMESSAPLAIVSQGKAPGGPRVTRTAVTTVTLGVRSIAYIGTGILAGHIINAAGSRAAMAIGLAAAGLWLLLALHVVRRNRSRLELWQLPGVTRVRVDPAASEIRAEGGLAVHTHGGRTWVGSTRRQRMGLNGWALPAPTRPRSNREARALLAAPFDPVRDGLWRLDTPAVDVAQTIVVPKGTEVRVHDLGAGRYVLKSRHLRLRARLGGRAVVEAPELKHVDVRLHEESGFVACDERRTRRHGVLGGRLHVRRARRKSTVTSAPVALSAAVAAELDRRITWNREPVLDPRACVGA